MWRSVLRERGSYMITRLVRVGAIATLLVILAPSGAAAFPGEAGRIAFTGRRTPEPMGALDYEVVSIAPGGSDPTILTDDDGPDSSPAWSPDGSRIAFEADPSFAPGRVASGQPSYAIRSNRMPPSGSGPIEFRRTQTSNPATVGWSTDAGPTCAAPPGDPSPLTSSAKKEAFTSVKLFHSAGRSPSGKIAVTGHTGMHASQSTHSSGWM